MANEELGVVQLKHTFYRDGFYKLLLSFLTVLTSVLFLIGISIYLYLDKPQPVYFGTDEEWRILDPVPVNQVYLSEADLVQWISDVLPKAFTYDFLNYTQQLQNVAEFFTPNGWKSFLDDINKYANYNEVLTSKLFISASAAGAPIILNKGLLEGKYAWWIQMPINVTYFSSGKTRTQPLAVRVLIIRVPTLNNLYGVGVENIIVTPGSADQIISG